MYSIDTEAQLFETKTSQDIRFFEKPQYTSSNLFPNQANTYTVEMPLGSQLKVLVTEKILEKVAGIIRDVKIEDILVELKFPHQPLLVNLPETFFRDIDQVYIGLEIEYQIIRDSSGIRKQKIIPTQNPPEDSKEIIELRNRILALLNDD